MLRAILILFLCSCSSHEPHSLKQWMNGDDSLKVLATTAMIADLVEKIGGDEVSTLVLIKGDLDPHTYQLVKGDEEKLMRADLIFANGLGLEHGPTLQSVLASDSKVIRLGDLIAREKPELIINHKGQIDPHIWMDIGIWSLNIDPIVKALSIKDPRNEGLYAERGEALKRQMQADDREVRNIILRIPVEKRYLVTSHDAFNYFARAYLAPSGDKENWQTRFQAPEGLAPESQLSIQDIREIIEFLSAYNIHVMFPESNVSLDSIHKILSAGKAKGLNLRISPHHLYGDAMGPPGSEGDTYTKMILHNANSMAEELSR